MSFVETLLFQRDSQRQRVIVEATPLRDGPLDIKDLQRTDVRI
jgi:hypothetical protein